MPSANARELKKRITTRDPAVDLTPLVRHPALMELDASPSSMQLLPAAARARLSAHVGRPIFRDLEGRW